MGPLRYLRLSLPPFGRNFVGDRSEAILVKDGSYSEERLADQCFLLRSTRPHVTLERNIMPTA